MIRTGKSLDDELSARRLTMIVARLERSDDRWFNGTLGAVDARLRQVDSALRFARGVTARIGSTEAGIRCADVLPKLELHRNELVALRDDLLNGASDRRGDAPRTGRRLANVTAAGPSPFAPTVGEVPQSSSPQARSGPGRDRRDEPMDGRFEHSQVQEWPPGSGQGWMPTPGGPSHLHPVHGPYSPNPQVYPGPHPMSAADPMPVPKQIGLPLGGPGRKAAAPGGWAHWQDQGSSMSTHPEHGQYNRKQYPLDPNTQQHSGPGRNGMPVVPKDSPHATPYNTGLAHPYDQGAHDLLNGGPVRQASHDFAAELMFD